MAQVEFTSQVERPVTPERPVGIVLDGRVVAVTQASPYDLADLAVGYLLCEQLLVYPDDLVSVEVDEDAAQVFVTTCGNAVSSDLSAKVHVRQSSGAGSRPRVFEVDGTSGRPVARDVTFDPDVLLGQMNSLCQDSPLRNAGQSVHGCGLGSAESPALLMVREDIGRHNAMDKLIGHAWLEGQDMSRKAMLITGRISAEMALKAHRSGVPLLASPKSATDDAIRRANELGLTLVSHCRDGRLRVLTHPERIAASA